MEHKIELIEYAARGQGREDLALDATSHPPPRLGSCAGTH